MRKTIAVAVSGVGGGVGQSIIKALHGTPYSVVGMDGESLGTGLYAVSKGYTVPYAHESGFIERVLEICTREKCALFFPGLDAELPILAKHAERFRSIGTTLIVSSPQVVETCDNKLLTYQFLSQHGIPAPVTIDLREFFDHPIALNFPLIVKPKTGGARSKNVFLVHKRSEVRRILSWGHVSENNGIVQEYIEGDEYTCGTINADGTHLGTIVMRRILRDGDTYKCFSVRNPVIEKTVEQVMTCLKPFGACNVQLRMKDGVPYVVEINARCSGTTAARALAGFNEPKMIADYLVQGTVPAFSIKESTILRYWKELVVENNKIRELETNTYIINQPLPAL